MQTFYFPGDNTFFKTYLYHKLLSYERKKLYIKRFENPNFHPLNIQTL